MNPTRITNSPIQIAVERTILIQPSLFEQPHLCCCVYLFYRWYGFDEDLGAVVAIGDEVCKSAFVGEVVVVGIFKALGSGCLLNGSPACAHVCGVELA